VTPEEDLAAREERVNEAGLEAEDLFWWLREADPEEAIEYLRALLRMRAEVGEVLKAHRRNEVSHG
jgi:hypothetical protein